MWRWGGDRLHESSLRFLEVLVVVAVVLGGLASFIMPRAIAWADDARRSACAENKAVVNAAAERWCFLKGRWPDRRLSDIGADPEYFPSGLPVCPLDGSRYELHPIRHCVQGHGH